MPKNINKQLQGRIGELIGKDYFKLEFGCKVIHTNTEQEWIVLYSKDSGFTACYHQKWLDGGHFGTPYYTDKSVLEIIGTEPPLQDLLMALEKHNSPEFIDFCENLWRTNLKETKDCNAYSDLMFYDLSLSLFNQTDETKQKILELLK